MSLIERRRIGAVVYEGHVRARTLPDDPAPDDLRTDWGEIEYVPAEQLRGAVRTIRAARDAARTPGDMQTVRTILNEALDRFDRHPTGGQ